MAERSPIQLDNEVKLNLEAYRDKQFSCKTHSDAVAELLRYYIRNEKQKIEDRERAQAEEQKRKETMIHLGDLKLSYMEFMKSLDLREESSGLDFLLDMYHNSDTIPKMSVMFLKTLK